MIYGKVGNLGHGKTLRMTVDGLALVTLRNKPDSPCWLAANYTVRPPEGVRFDLLPMDGFGDGLRALMREARAAGAGLVVLVDEIDTVWDAHAWQDMKRSHRYLLKQGRKYRLDLFYSAQFIDQVEKSLRNVTEEVELVKAYPRPTVSRREAGKRPWFIRGHRFRPAAVRELIGEPDKDKRLGSVWHRYDRRHEALYDTDEIIEPPDDEALCAKHRKEETEARCPRCHPERSVTPARIPANGSHPLAELVTLAADPERVGRALGARSLGSRQPARPQE